MYSLKDRREEVKRQLNEYNLPYKWLVSELARRGIRASRNEVSDVLTGHRCGDYACCIVVHSEYVLADYRKYYIERRRF